MSESCFSVIFALIRRSPKFWVRLNASMGGGARKYFFFYKVGLIVIMPVPDECLFKFCATSLWELMRVENQIYFVSIFWNFLQVNSKECLLSSSDSSYPLVRSFEIKESYLCVYSVSELEFRIHLKASPLIMPVKHKFGWDESLERYWNVSQGLL